MELDYLVPFFNVTAILESIEILKFADFFTPFELKAGNWLINLNVSRPGSSYDRR